MNKNYNCPFKSAQIEIVFLQEDIVVTSYAPFPGEDDDFETAYYWEQ